MQLPVLPINVAVWENLETEIHPGTVGVAKMKTFFMDDIRIRQVEYSPGFLSDHFCDKGHIIFCTEGDFSLELSDGKKYEIKEGMLCTISAPTDSHRSSSKNGCTLFIVD